ncbi:hypothetical protein V8C44DRAFT_344932 [Trichoderma aethiopicum]
MYFLVSSKPRCRSTRQLLDGGGRVCGPKAARGYLDHEVPCPSEPRWHRTHLYPCRASGRGEFQERLGQCLESPLAPTGHSRGYLAVPLREHALPAADLPDVGLSEASSVHDGRSRTCCADAESSNDTAIRAWRPWRGSGERRCYTGGLRPSRMTGGCEGTWTCERYLAGWYLFGTRNACRRLGVARYSRRVATIGYLSLRYY